MRNDDFSRRGFLRGMLGGAGVYLALPLMESLGRTAWAAEPAKDAASDGTPPLRQFILTVAGGTVIESWKPKAAGPLTTMPLTPTDFATLYGIVDQSFPDGARYGVDCLWSQDADTVFQGLARMVAEAPSPMSNAIGVIYGRNSALARDLPHPALSVTGPVSVFLVS